MTKGKDPSLRLNGVTVFVQNARNLCPAKTLTRLYRFWYIALCGDPRSSQALPVHAKAINGRNLCAQGNRFRCVCKAYIQAQPLPRNRSRVIRPDEAYCTWLDKAAGIWSPDREGWKPWPRPPCQKSKGGFGHFRIGRRRQSRLVVKKYRITVF